jgi:hypothetical protein
MNRPLFEEAENTLILYKPDYIIKNKDQDNAIFNLYFGGYK